MKFDNINLKEVNSFMKKNNNNNVEDMIDQSLGLNKRAVSAEPKKIRFNLDLNEENMKPKTKSAFNLARKSTLNSGSINDRLAHLQNLNKNLNQQINEAENDVVKIRQKNNMEISSLETTIIDLSKQAFEINASSTDKKEKMKKTTAEINSQIESKAQQIERLKSSIAAFRNDIKSSKKQIKNLQVDIETSRNSIELKDKKILSLAEKMESIKIALQRSSMFVQAFEHSNQIRSWRD